MGDDFTSYLFINLIFSCIGFGAWIYGKRQRSGVHLALGAVLMVYPYFVGNVYVLCGIGVALTAALFVFRP